MHSAEEMKKHVSTYMKVFGALLVLTVVTVAVSYLEVSFGVGLVIGLFIATVKASLVACFFMHLISEKAIIYWVLGFTAFFFVVLMVVPFVTDLETVMAAKNVS